MRTKTLALSAVLGLVGCASVMAQANVYSLNAVGYINLTLPVGFSMIANQLSNSVDNTIGTLLNDASGVYDGVVIYKYAAGAYTTDTGDSQGSGNANGWDNNGVITLNPGEAAWLNNGTGAPLAITFVGTVPQGANTVVVSPGFNMIASPVPFAGDVVTTMGLTQYEANADGSDVFVWNNPATGHPHGGYTTYTVDIAGGGGAGFNGDWDPPGDPQAGIGQGFWFNATAGFNWVQTFSVNP